MRLVQLLCLCLLLPAAALNAESKNPADYPLRIHIFGHSQTTFYHGQSIEEAKGEGRANLFENSEAQGVDFSYECSDKLRVSFGYETYPAKWKKPHQELVVLLPVFGKANSYFTCNLKTQIKDYAYAAHNGRMDSEPTADFKTWMIKHDYDPEHGKDIPTRSAPQPAGPATSATPRQ
jgi:hypothetical protein